MFLPLNSLAKLFLMNQILKWCVGLVNISAHFWFICSVKPLLIGLGSSQHTSAILDYAHDFFSVQNYPLLPKDTQDRSSFGIWNFLSRYWSRLFYWSAIERSERCWLQIPKSSLYWHSCTRTRSNSHSHPHAHSYANSHNNLKYPEVPKSI